MFCLSRARKALRHYYNFSIIDGKISSVGFDESSSEMEDLVIALQHVYESCKILNKDWPSGVSREPLQSANRFVKVWKESSGPQLRHAYAHYEDALAKDTHHLRKDDVDSVTWHKVEYSPTEGSWSQNASAGPGAVVLLGTEYSLDGVYEAVLGVETDFRNVLAPIATPVEPRESGMRLFPIATLVNSATRNLGIVEQHNSLRGGVDWDRKDEIDRR